MDWLNNSLRWCYRMFWYTLAVLIILVAIAISLVRVFIPDLKEYREEVEFFASTVLEQEVTIESMEAEMSGFTPLIIFNGIKMFDHDRNRELIRFEQARLTIDPLRSIADLKLVPRSFTIYGVSLGIHRKADGTFSIQGVDVDELGKQFESGQQLSSNGSKELEDWLFKRSDLAIKNSTVYWQNDVRKTGVSRFENVNFYIRNDGNRHQVTGTVTLPPELGREFEVAFDLDGNILDPKQWAGRFYTRGSELNISNWDIKPQALNTSLNAGTLDVQVWGSWQAGEIQSLSGSVTASALQFVIKDEVNPFDISRITTSMDWQRQQGGWRLHLDKFQYEGKNGLWPESGISIDYAETDKSRKLNAHADFLRLHDIRELLQRSQLLDKTLQNRLTQLAPTGEVNSFTLASETIRDEQTYYIKGQLNGVSIKAVDKFPGVKNVSGTIHANHQGGHAMLQSKQSALLMPEYFRKPIALNRLDASLQWWREAGQWVVQTRNATLENSDISGSLSSYVAIPDGKASPYLDMQVRFENGKAQSVPDYLPVTIMDDELVGWLDQAFKAGRVSDGGFVFNGRLKDFPFKDYSGNMLADFNVQDVQLHYQPDWPDIQVRSGNLRITGLGLTAFVPRANVYDSQLRRVRVNIKQFSSPYLDIRGNYKGKTDDLFHYLTSSPIAVEAQSIYKQAKVSGTTQGKLTLQIPLMERVRNRYPLTYHGEAVLSNSQIDLWNSKLLVEAINGKINFSSQTVSSEKLTANMFGHPVDMKLFSQKKPVEDILLSMRGRINMAHVHSQITHPVLSHLTGESDWQAVISLGHQKDSGQSDPGYVQVSSRLKGIASTLPSPMTKPADAVRKLDVRVPFSDSDELNVFVSYAKEWSAALSLNTGTAQSHIVNNGSVHFQSDKARLPNKPQFLIKGWLPSVDLHGWQQVFDGAQDKNNPSLFPASLPVRLDLDYVMLESETMDTSESVDDEQAVNIDPRHVPLISGEIRNFNYGKIKLGKVNIKSLRHTDGILLSELNIDGPLVKLKGEGSWLWRDNRHQTNILFTMSSDDVGVLLDNLGYAAVIRKGRLQSVFQGYWYDAPTRFRMETVNATIAAVIDKGILSEVKPGAGRLLGLLSVSELPRRLILDFSEFRYGLSFDQIVGQVEIRDGIANTETLKIISPVALINIDGSTNILEKKLDQTVNVIPNLSGTVPVVSWLAWGGQVGVLAFLLDQLFGDAFDTTVGTEYLVTGSWEKPVVTRVSQPQDTIGLEEDEDEF